VASVVSVMLFKSSFKVLSGYFYVSLNLTSILLFPNLAEFRDTATLKMFHNKLPVFVARFVASPSAVHLCGSLLSRI